MAEVTTPIDTIMKNAKSFMEEIGYDIVEKILDSNPFVPFDGTKNIQIIFDVTIKEVCKFAGLDGYYTSTFILEVKSQIIVGKHSAQISLFHFRILFDVGVNKKIVMPDGKTIVKKISTSTSVYFFRSVLDTYTPNIEEFPYVFDNTIDINDFINNVKKIYNEYLNKINNLTEEEKEKTFCKELPADLESQRALV